MQKLECLKVSYHALSINQLKRTAPITLSMANTILFFPVWCGIRFLQPPPSIIFIFIFIITISFAVSQPYSTGCNLDFESSSFGNTSSCEGGDWGGFLRSNCCGVAFDGYLYGLGQRANQTGGKIYLNDAEQRNCLTSMKTSEGDVLGCGIESLTSGGSGCSDFSIIDVANKLADDLRNLGEDCKQLDSDGDWDQKCGACLRRWEETGKTLSNREFTKIEMDVCRFAVLVSLTSSRIEDKKWAQMVYQCLGEQSLDKG